MLNVLIVLLWLIASLNTASEIRSGEFEFTQESGLDFRQIRFLESAGRLIVDGLCVGAMPCIARFSRPHLFCHDELRLIIAISKRYLQSLLLVFLFS